MAASKYNGMILPALPQTTYPYLLIMDTTDQNGDQVYALWACDQPYKASIDSRDTFCHPKDSNVEVYVANMTSWVWDRGSFSISGDGNAEFINTHGEFIWTNHNIYMQNSLPPTMPTWDQVAFPYLLLQETCVATTDDNVFPKWWAWYSSEPFVMENPNAPEVGEVASPIGYGVLSTTTGFADGCQGYYIWGSDAVTGWRTLSNTGITARLAFDPEEPLNNLNVWSNHDIVGTKGYEIKANSWFELLCYKASEPEAVIVKAPVITSITGGRGVYVQGDIADPLNCTSTSPDEGVLSYKWYKNGVVCGYNASYTPSTKLAGEFTYYCEVTNSLYGDMIIATSDTITIRVKIRRLDEVIGYTLRVAGVPLAEEIAMMLCRKKNPAQDAPETSLYLYGTPAPTALTYNGVELPNIETVWTDKETYPYAYITSSYDDVRLTLMNKKIVVYSDNLQFWSAAYITYRIVDGVYEVEATSSNASGTLGNVKNGISLIWTSIGVLYYNSEDVYLATSDPEYTMIGGNIGLRSGESVTYYDGAVLPKLPERQRKPYQCDSILKTETGWVFLCTKREFDLQDENTVYYPNADTSLWYSHHLFTDEPFTEWGAVEYAENCNISVNKDVFMWSNLSVEDTDYICHLRGSAPIPVTGIVEWADGVPIYEVANHVIVYESTVTTVDDGTKNGAYALLDDMPDLHKYGTYRIIVNGNTEYSKNVNPEYDAYVALGNVWLSKAITATSWHDDGGDHWITLVDSWNPKAEFYTRTAGTYSIKVEWYDV